MEAKPVKNIPPVIINRGDEIYYVIILNGKEKMDKMIADGKPYLQGDRWMINAKTKDSNGFTTIPMCYIQKNAQS